MAKSSNYLAPPSERQRQFKLPEQQKIEALIDLTHKIKQTWSALLPEEILTTLMVVQCDANQLVMTTTNHTIANHLTYTYRMLLELIHNDYPYLQTITQLKFKVISPRYEASNPLVNNVATLPKKRNPSVNNVTSRKLSAITRQNITQLTQNVTLDPRLSEILLRLANED